MQKEYTITGMTCNGCVNSVKNKLESLPQVKSAIIDLADQQGILELKQAVGIDKLQETIGHYQIRERITESQEVATDLLY